MKRRRDRARKGVSVGISLLILTLSVAVPVLERADLVDEPVAESEHNPATCPTAHDHTVCTQVGANLSAASDVQEHQLPFAVLRVATPIETPPGVSAAFSEGHRSRAPPLA